MSRQVCLNITLPLKHRRTDELYPLDECTPPDLPHFTTDSPERPPFSYTTLLKWAILQSPQKQLTSQEIIEYIENSFQYYRADDTWKVLDIPVQ